MKQWMGRGMAAWMAVGMGTLAACFGSSTAEAPDGGGTRNPSSSSSGGSLDATFPPGSDSGGTKADASAVATPPPDFLWYVLDETSGTTAHDSSPNHFDISVPGIAWNQGGIFDGMTACGATTVGPAYRSPPITISAWLTPAARTDSPDGYTLQPYPPNAISDDVPGVGGYGIGLNVWSTGSALAAEDVAPCTQAGLCAANGTQNAAAADAGGLSCTSSSSCNQGFAAGTEYFVVLTVDAAPASATSTIAQVYVNGALFDQDTAAILPADPMPPLRLGCHNMDDAYGTTRFFDGRMRDVRVYLRQLAANEVEQLYVDGPTLHGGPSLDAGAGSDAAAE